LGIQGALAEAERLVAEVCHDDPYCLSGAAAAFSLCGDSTRAVELLTEVEKRAERQYVSPGALARFYLVLGNSNRALDFLERGLEERDPMMVLVGRGGRYDPLRKRLRFQAIIEKMDFPEN
jgi:hypothetical protein